MDGHHVDLAIIGGGLGGVAAALAACEKGLSVILTEETEWIGGQVTSQGVPPDEHPWIEEFGATGRYKLYRRKVRDAYRRIMKVVDDDKALNPGNGLVSAICHDPRVTLHVLQELLLPFQLTGHLTVLVNATPVKVEKQGRRVEKVWISSGGRLTGIEAPYYIDATETGDLLPLAEISYVTGAESKEDTGEPHALEEADPLDIQAFTYVLGMEYREGGYHVIPEPDMYTFWRDFQPGIWPDKLLSFFAPHPITKEKRAYSLFDGGMGFPLWAYRRILDPSLFRLKDGIGEVTLMNWPQNDYFLGNVYDVNQAEKEKNLYQAKQLSLSLLYWLQTEAPREDGGRGYPGLKLRKDLFMTEDGLAKAPYIRESRRIKAEYTVVEQDVSPDFGTGPTGTRFPDRVGVGSYSIDLHPSMKGRTYLDIQALPFYIPFGALIPKDTDNLLAGCKNIGTTHITNGCFRLHPVEWNIGEAGGAAVAFCLKHDLNPRQLREHRMDQFQDVLRQDGFELEWPWPNNKEE